MNKINGIKNNTVDGIQVYIECTNIVNNPIPRITELPIDTVIFVGSKNSADFLATNCSNPLKYFLICVWDSIANNGTLPNSWGLYDIQNSKFLETHFIGYQLKISGGFLIVDSLTVLDNKLWRYILIILVILGIFLGIVVGIYYIRNREKQTVISQPLIKRPSSFIL